MAFFKSQKRSSPIPQTTAMQKQRQKQVTSLRNHFPQMIEVGKDSEYQLKFKSYLGTEHTVYLLFTDNFPNQSPSVVVYPPLEHPWFNDANVIVGCKQLNEFTMHQDLGRVVDALVKELANFKVNSVPREMKSHFYTPPSSFPPQPTDCPPLSVTPPTTGGSNLPQIFSVGGREDEEPSPWIDYESIANLDLEKLEELNASSDDGQLFAYMNFEGFQAEGEKERVRLLQENLELAQQNVQYEPFLAQERETLKTKQNHVKELLAEFRESESQQSKLMEFSEFRVMQNLEQLVNQDNTTADRISEEFLEGKVGLRIFLSDFRETRESSFLRNAKHYKLQQILSDSRQITGLK